MTMYTPSNTALRWVLHGFPRQEAPHSVKVALVHLHLKLQGVRSFCQALLDNDPWRFLEFFGLENGTVVPPGERQSKLVAPIPGKPGRFQIICLSKPLPGSNGIEYKGRRPFTGEPLEVLVGGPDYEALREKVGKYICLNCDLPALNGRVMCKEHMKVIVDLTLLWLSAPAWDLEANCPITPEVKAAVDPTVVETAPNDTPAVKTVPTPKMKRQRKSKAKKSV